MKSYHNVSPDRQCVSPSSRRAWIEMKGSDNMLLAYSKSPSSRRAWIEMPKQLQIQAVEIVALLAEGVD